MKLKYNRTPLLLSSVLASLLGCGGGGGGDGQADFAGVWNGSATFVEDTCPGAEEEFSIYFAHLINQDGTDIVLDNGASVFQGTASESGFSVALKRAAREPVPFFGTCEETITWRYEQIERDIANFVVRTSTITCVDGATSQSCSRTFTGSAYRQNSRPVFPIDIGVGGATGLEGDAAVPENAVSDTQL